MIPVAARRPANWLQQSEPFQPVWQRLALEIARVRSTTAAAVLLRSLGLAILAVGLALLMCLAFFVAYTLPVSAGEELPRNKMEAEIHATYLAFVDAQNARDLERIGAFFIDGPEFLWVSDGRSVWGREATLARMGGFQKAEVWTVHPSLEKARVIELSQGTALLHLPLVLEIGARSAPDRLPFLVSALFVRNGDAWRIAGLLTTTEK